MEFKPPGWDKIEEWLYTEVPVPPSLIPGMINVCIFLTIFLWVEIICNLCLTWPESGPSRMVLSGLTAFVRLELRFVAVLKTATGRLIDKVLLPLGEGRRQRRSFHSELLSLRLLRQTPSGSSTCPVSCARGPSVYDYASQAEFDKTISIPNASPDHEKSSRVRQFLLFASFEIICKAYHQERAHEEPKTAKHLAMVLVSRQIHVEASAMYHANAPIDFKYANRPSGLEYILSPPSKFQNRLQFVRHIEMDKWQAIPLLFASGRERAFQSYSDGRRGTLLKSNPRQLFATRTLFFNVESFTVYSYRFSDLPPPPDPDDPERDAIGVQIICNLADPPSRVILRRLFPGLRDIRSVNTEFGGERFWRRRSGQWELYYTHEAIPLSHQRIAQNFRPGVLCDGETSLVVATTLGCFI